jgi:hypothetical protein
MLGKKWRKSSYSNPSGNCVQARRSDGGVEVGDTKDPNRPTLQISAEAWRAFLKGL